MAVRGGGPSRRSHTKSRKGCKTCKRRHIRCDESFPQCRNCTKHHVRCDYMDATTPDADSMTTASSEHASPTPTPTDDSSVSHPRPASVYSDLGLSFMTDPETLYGSDHHLITNLLAIADNLDSKGASDLTTWVSCIRRNVSLAHHWPSVNDALKGFSASQSAWTTQSPAARDQSLNYGSAALSALHQAVGQFSKENADSVLVTALLLISQSRDWLSWSSLLGGLSSITAGMESWESESRYPDFIKRINNQFASKKQRPEPRHLSDMERSETFRTIYVALQQLRLSLVERPVELHWVDQIIDLINRLQTAEPPRTAEAEFNKLYVLRKWILWLPVLLLQEGPVDMIKVAVVAHLYGVALALSPVFPHLIVDLCGNPSAEPLIACLSRMDAMKNQPGFFDTVDCDSLMQFPQAALATYNETNFGHLQQPQPTIQIPDISMCFDDSVSMPGNLSPAFTPAAFEPLHSRASSIVSTYLEVPGSMAYQASAGFTHNINNWAAFPSPGFPSQEFFGNDDLLFDDGQARMLSSNLGTFIQPCEIWT